MFTSPDALAPDQPYQQHADERAREPDDAEHGVGRLEDIGDGALGGHRKRRKHDALDHDHEAVCDDNVALPASPPRAGGAQGCALGAAGAGAGGLAGAALGPLVTLPFGSVK